MIWKGGAFLLYFIDKDINEIKINTSFEILVNIENSERVKIANRLKEELSNVGIQAMVNELPFDQYLEKLTDSDFDLFIGGWELSTIPDYTFAFHSSQISNGRNYINYNDPQMDLLLEAAFLDQSGNAYSELQKYIAEEVVYISILFRKSVLLTGDKVRGKVTPVINDIYSNISEWFIYEVS